mmetsp:Transcript_20650/g.57608  ORF Transcript_20650/g.57608 Transcript_20650/m.57608 type:complete len:341 (+) Transcript_20650:70-1092(+)
MHVVGPRRFSGLACAAVAVTLSAFCARFSRAHVRERADGRVFKGYGHYVVKRINQTLDCMSMGKAPRLVSLMLPKTGSRHLMSILKEEYSFAKGQQGCPEVSIFHWRPKLSIGTNCTDLEVFPNQPNFERWQALMDECARRSIPMIAMMRDPVEFLLSYYSFVEPNWTAHPLEWDKLGALVKDTEANSNVQLALLSGKRGIPLAIVPPGCTHKTHLELTEADLELFRERVDAGQLLIGAVESFESAIRSFAAALRWSKFDVDAYAARGDFLPRGPDRFNVDSRSRSGDQTKRRIRQEDLPVDLVEEIERKSALDRRLHALALSASSAFSAASSSAHAKEL